MKIGDIYHDRYKIIDFKNGYYTVFDMKLITNIYLDVPQAKHLFLGIKTLYLSKEKMEFAEFYRVAVIEQEKGIVYHFHDDKEQIKKTTLLKANQVKEKEKIKKRSVANMNLDSVSNHLLKALEDIERDSEDSAKLSKQIEKVKAVTTVTGQLLKIAEIDLKAKEIELKATELNSKSKFERIEIANDRKPLSIEQHDPIN